MNLLLCCIIFMSIMLGSSDNHWLLAAYIYIFFYCRTNENAIMFFFCCCCFTILVETMLQHVSLSFKKICRGAKMANAIFFSVFLLIKFNCLISCFLEALVGKILLPSFSTSKTLIVWGFTAVVIGAYPGFYCKYKQHLVSRQNWNAGLN